MNVNVNPPPMAQALGLYRAGRFAEAESRCRQILAVESDNADSLHLALFLPGEKREIGV